MRRASLVTIFLLLHACLLHAQNFGGSPASVKWRQINTDTARIIFPAGYEAKAQRIAAIIHSLQKNHTYSIGDEMRKINIVLQNQTLISNGYVGLAPFRSEFYTNPPQNAFELGAVSWNDNLSLHEFRHVQQNNNFNKGLSKVARFILGEQGQLVANAAAIPDWFYEGDAVFNETKFSRQGRGTLPLFLSAYQSLLLGGKKYSYMKLRNGSLRDYVPNHYDLGYLLVGYGRKKYGDDIWRKITDDAARFKPLFYPFQGAVKKQTGIPFNQFVNDAMGYYAKQWESAPAEKTEWVTGLSQHDVVDYQYPYAVGDGSLIVVKSSKKKIPAFYRINAGKREEKIATKSISADNYFSYNNGRIIYAAFQPDLRWANRDFTSIRLIDVATCEEKIIVKRAKYVSPDISHDGSSVIAVDMHPMGGSSVVVMDNSGVVRDSLPQSDLVYSYPKFSADDKHYYIASRNEEGSMSLLKYTIGDKKPGEVLMHLSNRIIGFLQVQGDTVTFTTTFNGRDEIWAVIDGAERRGPFRLSSFPTGIYQGVLQNNDLIGSAFTADGYRLGRFQPLWQRVDIRDELAERYLSDSSTTGAYTAKDHQLLQSIQNTVYPVSKYSKSFGLLNIHSWRPYYENPEYSFTLYGQNILNTLQSEIAYTYNQNEESHKLSYEGIFGGSFVEPLFGVSQTWNRSGSLNKDTILHWNEFQAHAGLQLPLNLTKGRLYQFLTLSSTWNIDNVQWTGIARKLARNDYFQFLQSRLSYVLQTQKAEQQIYPRAGMAYFLQFKNSITNNSSRQALASTSYYLPGLGNNHSIVVQTARQLRDTMNLYLFSNNFPFSRGYAAVDFPRMWKWAVNYHFPIAYPDRGFGNLVYFLRVRANLFFDYTEGKSLRTNTSYTFRSAGTELFFDTKWWNQQPVTFGIRYSRLIDNEFRGTTQPNVWEFIMPVSLF